MISSFILKVIIYMHTNPSQVQQVYMGCDALYWITDGDCQKQSFAAFEQTLQPRHMIVSEFWIQRDMIPMDFVTMDAGGVGFDSFECVEQGERFQMRAALRSRALQCFMAPPTGARFAGKSRGSQGMEILIPTFLIYFLKQSKI